MFQQKPGYMLYQFLLWFVVILMVLGSKQNRIISAFNFKLWPSNIVDIGFIVVYIFIIHFINKFIAYKTIEEIPSYLPKEFFELNTLIKDFIINGAKNKWIWFKNIKIKSENKIISIYEYRFKNHLLPSLPKSLIKKKESSMEWKRLWDFIPFSKVLVFSFYTFTIFYASTFMDKYDESRDLSGFHTDYLLILWIVLFIFSTYLLIRELQFEKKWGTILFTFLLILQFSYFNYSNIKESLGYYLTLLLFISTILYPYSYIIIMFFSKFKKIAISEYNLAIQRKNAVENFEIIKDFITRHSNIDTFSNGRIKELLTNYNYSLKYEKNLKDFINSHNIKIDDDFRNIFKSYVIPVESVKKARGEEIRSRNKINLSFAKSFAKYFLIFYFILRFFPGNYITNTHYFNYLDISLVLAFSRLFIRSIEIGLSFYNDLYDRPIDKKSLLTNKDRARLAVNSLFEILIFSFITIFCIFSRSTAPPEINISLIDLINLSFIKIFLMESYRIFEVVLYTISVSLFNISFADFSEAPLYELAPLKITHVIQVMSSLILLTICLSSYINSNSPNKKVIIKKYLDEYYLVEQNIYQEQKKLLIGEGHKQIKDLKSKVLKMYHEGDIDADDFEIYMLTIDSYLLENE